MSTAISFRKTVLGVKVESTKGTPAKPAATTDFVRLQEDFSGSPNYQNLENAELTGTIGGAAPIRGIEEPNGSFSHYLRHSGTEGQEPNFAPILKGLFGDQKTNGTQRVTAASSTTTLIKAGTGTGSDFVRGVGMLIKDNTNGWNIRVSHSRSTDDITPSFKLASAPGTGVSLGKCVAFLPADADHQALSLWGYMGNAGALQLWAGSMITSMSAEMAAGQLINANFSFEALRYLFNPIEVSASDTKLDFEDDDGVVAATLTAGWYNPHELAAALQTAMRAVQTSKVATVTYNNSTGKFAITSTGTLLSLLWSTGSNTGNTIGDKIGFVTGSDDTGTAAATGYTSDNAVSWAAGYTPSYDSASPNAAKANEVMIGDQDDYLTFSASKVSFSLTNERTGLDDVTATSGRADAIFTKREAKVTLTARLSQNDAEWFERYRAATETRFQYNFGTKTGGKWDAGKCGYLYLPTATVSSFNIAQENGVVTLELELTAFVNSSGEGEVYLGFL